MAEHISGDGVERYAMGAVKAATDLAALAPQLRALGGRSRLDSTKQMQ